MQSFLDHSTAPEDVVRTCNEILSEIKNIKMKLLVILFLIKLYARKNIFNYAFVFDGSVLHVSVTACEGVAFLKDSNDTEFVTKNMPNVIVFFFVIFVMINANLIL